MTRNKMQMHDNNAAKPYRTPLIASAMSSWNMTCRAKVALLRQSLRYRKPAEEGECGKGRPCGPTAFATASASSGGSAGTD
jgi:hypothetical protein